MRPIGGGRRNLEGSGRKLHLYVICEKVLRTDRDGLSKVPWDYIKPNLDGLYPFVPF
jgi:hypothetical protein